MSVASVNARINAQSKLDKMLRVDPKARVDASDYTPPGPMDADVQTGPRPISRRQYKRGGKILGEELKRRADRKPRATGGRALVDAYQNRDMKEANPGGHRGGYASGGHASGCGCAKCSGGRVGKADGGASYGGTRPTGGRMARASGGRSKKGMNVNIIIAQPKQGGPMPMPPGAAGPVGMHQGAVPPPPPMAPPPGGAPPMAGGAPPPMMPRASGGRAYPLKDGSGGGKGRLQKIKAYG